MISKQIPGLLLLTSSFGTVHAWTPRT